MLTQTAEMATLSNAAPPLLSDAACTGLPPPLVSQSVREVPAHNTGPHCVGNFHDTLSPLPRERVRKGKHPALHT